VLSRSSFWRLVATGFAPQMTFDARNSTIHPGSLDRIFDVDRGMRRVPRGRSSATSASSLEISCTRIAPRLQPCALLRSLVATRSGDRGKCRNVAGLALKQYETIRLPAEVGCGLGAQFVGVLLGGRRTRWSDEVGYGAGALMPKSQFDEQYVADRHHSAVAFLQRISERRALIRQFCRK
jgi:hypothetical protein